MQKTGCSIKGHILSMLSVSTDWRYFLVDSFFSDVVVLGKYKLILKLFKYELELQLIPRGMLC